MIPIDKFYDPKRYMQKKAKSYLMKVGIFFFVLILMFVVVIGAVSEVFSFFMRDNEGVGSLADMSIEQLIQWGNKLSDKEIEQMLKDGASINPRKFEKYYDIEEKSYKKNVTIKIPVTTTINGSSSTSYIDHPFTRGDTAFPYRQWWQSTASLDTVKESAIHEKNLEIVLNAERDLKPKFTFADSRALDYQNGDKYAKTSKYEEVVKVTERTTVTDTGSTNSPTTTTKVTTTTRPLPFLEKADIMFGEYKFKYQPTNNESTSTSVSSGSYTVDDGYGATNKTTHTTTTTTTITSSVSSWELEEEIIDYTDRFKKFLLNNKIDHINDPHIMYQMAEQLPQSNYFLNEFGKYLNNLTGENSYTGFEGGFEGGGSGAGSGSSDSDTGGGSYEGAGGKLAWAVPGFNRISSNYGYRIHPITHTKKMHTGIDIPAPSGKDVISSEDGVVILSGWSGSYGKTVKIDHGGGISTLYAHNSVLTVRNGQKVKRGQVIAKIGSTGGSTGPHSHYEVRKNNKHVNPVPWVR